MTPLSAIAPAKVAEEDQVDPDNRRQPINDVAFVGTVLTRSHRSPAPAGTI